MRFTDLRIGEEFEIDGEGFRKISPLMATSLTTGKQQLVRRSANITLIGDKPTPKSDSSGQLDIASIYSALEQHHSKLEAMIIDADFMDDAQKRQIMERITSLQSELYRELGID